MPSKYWISANWDNKKKNNDAHKALSKDEVFSELFWKNIILHDKISIEENIAKIVIVAGNP